MREDRRRLSLNTDEELVVSAGYGDLNAFDELVRRYRFAVMAVAKDIVGASEHAEDVAQDVFLSVYKSLPQLGDPTKFAGWLYAITRNRARRVGTREKARRAEPLSAVDEFLIAKSTELSTGAFEQAERSVDNARLVEEMADLPHEYGQVLELYYGQQWSVERIGEFLLVPRSTVKWRLFQGRKLLRQRLGDGTGLPPAFDGDNHE